MVEINNNKSVAYKYTEVSCRLIESVKKGEIYYAPREKLNDPFDCAPLIRKDVGSRRVIEALRLMGFEVVGSDVNTEIPQFVGSCVDQLLGRSGVVSLSRGVASPSMWNHYAKEHSGVALGYSVDVNIDSVIRPRFYAKKIEYTGRGELFLSDLCDAIMSKGEANESFQRVIDAAYFSKTPHWVYEEELRLLSVNENGALPAEDRLVSIHFGLRTPNDCKALLLSSSPPGTAIYETFVGDRGLCSRQVSETS